MVVAVVVMGAVAVGIMAVVILVAVVIVGIVDVAIWAVVTSIIGAAVHIPAMYIFPAITLMMVAMLSALRAIAIIAASMAIGLGCATGLVKFVRIRATT